MGHSVFLEKLTRKIMIQPNKMGFRPIMSDPLPYNGDNAEAASKYALRTIMSKRAGHFVCLTNYLPTHE